MAAWGHAKWQPRGTPVTARGHTSEVKSTMAATLLTNGNQGPPHRNHGTRVPWGCKVLSKCTLATLKASTWVHGEWNELRQWKAHLPDLKGGHVGHIPLGYPVGPHDRPQ